MYKKMNEILEWYPGYNWIIEYEMRKDLSGELVPYTFIMLGKYDDDLDENFPLYIDEQGEIVKLTKHQKIQAKPHPTAYECATFGYDCIIEDCVNEIYNEIIKRKNLI